MPSRYLRAGILDSKRIGRLSEGAVALYYRLLSLIDDYGRYEADPELIIVNAYKWVAGGYTAEMIEQRLQECATAGAITIYEAKGKRLLEVYDPERRPFAKKSRYADPVPVGNRKELTGTDRAGGPSPNTNTETKTNTPSLNSSLKEINTPPVERETPLGPVRIAGKSPRTPSEVLRESLVVEWFEQGFWPIYWRKSAKQAAWKAFKAKVTTQAEFDAALIGIRTQSAAMLSREEEHRPHAATWINQERWNDEQSPPARASPNDKRAHERAELMRRLQGDLKDAGRSQIHG